MTTMQATSTHRIEDATAPLWVGFGPRGWGDVVRDVRNDRPATAGEVIRTAGLDWRVEQYPVEAVIPPAPGEEEPRRVGVPRMLANVRSDTGAVLGVVGDGYRPLQNGDAFALADALVDSGEAHWIGAGSTRGGARVHALMRLDREITIGGASGEDLLPLLLVRNGHDGGLAVTVSVAPFRLACLNGMIVPVEGAARGAVLAGGGAVRAGEKLVCACFSVGLETLRAGIAGRRLTTVTEIGGALRAGTNCGSCIPELREILRESLAPA